MEGKANFSRKNVNNLDKESYDLAYSVTDCGTEEDCQKIKDEFDKIVAHNGGVISKNPNKSMDEYTNETAPTPESNTENQ